MTLTGVMCGICSIYIYTGGLWRGRR